MAARPRGPPRCRYKDRTGKTFGRRDVNCSSKALLTFDTRHPVEIIVARLTELQRTLVGNADHFEGITIDTAFDVPVRDAVDLYLAVRPFEGRGIVEVGEISERNLYRNQLILAVLLLVQPGIQAEGGVLFHHFIDQPVADPVKEEYPTKQYGSKLSQSPTN